MDVKVPQLRTVNIMIFAQGKWQGRVDVAIKQLRNDRIEQGGYENAKEEFFKEWRTSQTFNHPNIVQVRSIFFAVKYFHQSNMSLRKICYFY